LKQKYSSIPANAVSAFWIEQECRDEADYYLIIEKWNTFLADLNIDLNNIWFGADESDRFRIVNMRHDLPVMVNDIIRQRGVRKLGTDIAVPNHLFKAFYEHSIAAVKENGFEYVAFGHFGDSHLHLNILPRNFEELTLGKQLCDYLCENAILLGGTFSAEHGVGKLKKHYLKMMIGDFSLDFMRNVKQLFDPNYILGRGNLFEK
ncbi:FAD-linked oxidase C-terminal domain-containing protein, partial [Daejeonella sp.]